MFWLQIHVKNDHMEADAALKRNDDLLQYKTTVRYVIKPLIRRSHALYIKNVAK